MSNDIDFGVDYCENTTMHSTCHFHDYYELCYFEDGYRTYVIGDEYFDIYPDCITLIKPYVQHSTKGSNNATRTVIYFGETFLNEFFTVGAKNSMLKTFDEKVKRVTGKSTSLKKAVASIKNAYSCGDRELCAFLLAELLHDIKTQCDSAAAEKTENDYLISPVVQYISKNIKTIDNVSDIAAAFHISSSYLSAVFKNSVGTPIKQYVINMRINLAARKLISTDENIGEIALDCGFTSQTHFSNTFRKHLKLSPKEYREIYKEKD